MKNILELTRLMPKLRIVLRQAVFKYKGTVANMTAIGKIEPTRLIRALQRTLI